MPTSEAARLLRPDRLRTDRSASHLSKVIGASGVRRLPALGRADSSTATSLRWQGWVEYPTHGRRFLQETMVPFSPPGAEPVQAIVVFGRDHTDLKLREEAVGGAVRSSCSTSEALKAAIVDHALGCARSPPTGAWLHRRIQPGCRGHVRPQARRRDGSAGEPGHHARALPRARTKQVFGRHGVGWRSRRVLGKRMELHRVAGRWRANSRSRWCCGAPNVGGTGFYTASLVDVTERYNAARSRSNASATRLRQSEKAHRDGQPFGRCCPRVEQPTGHRDGPCEFARREVRRPEALKRRRAAHPRSGRALRPHRAHLPQHGAQQAGHSASSVVSQRSDACGRRDAAATATAAHGVEMKTAAGTR